MREDIYDTMASHEDRHWWFVGRRKILQAAIEHLHLPAGARILEVGAGTGGNTAMLRQFGAVVSLEPNARAREYLLAKTGEVALGGFLPDVSPLGQQTFDLIVMFDVLEHIEEDRATITALSQHLRPGGRLMISVPAFPQLWCAHDEAHHHKKRYTKQHLVDTVCGSSNLTCVQVGFFNTWLFPAIAGVRLVQRAMRRGGFDQDRVPAARLNAALARLFGSERFLAARGRLPIGVSLLLVAQAPR